MKYLENIELERLSYFLTGHEIGNTILKSRIEAFSCKRAGDDKKLSKSLDQKFAEDYVASSSTSLGDMSQSATRKLLIDLVQTMNASFMDYDFSRMSAESFRSEVAANVIQQINSYLSEVTTSRPQFLNELWKSINEVITIQDCDCYSYVPDYNDDPLCEGAIWSFNFFFVNKELKRICYFTCVATPKGRQKQLYGADNEDDEDDGNYCMDESFENYDEEA